MTLFSLCWWFHILLYNTTPCIFAEYAFLHRIQPKWFWFSKSTYNYASNEVWQVWFPFRWYIAPLTSGLNTNLGKYKQSPNIRIAYLSNGIIHFNRQDDEKNDFVRVPPLRSCSITPPLAFLLSMHFCTGCSLNGSDFRNLHIITLPMRYDQLGSLSGDT